MGKVCLFFHLKCFRPTTSFHRKPGPTLKVNLNGHEKRQKSVKTPPRLFFAKNFSSDSKIQHWRKNFILQKKLYFFPCRKTTAIIAATFVSNALFFFIPTERQDWICFFSYAKQFSSFRVRRDFPERLRKKPISRK